MMKISRVVLRISSYIRYRVIMPLGRKARKLWRNQRDQNRLKNKEFTIISSNCLSGVISHDLGLKFLSPTVNLYIPPAYFIRFLEDLPHYLGLDLAFVDNYGLPYPVAVLEDVPVFFIHYKTKQEALEKWEARKKRIRWDNLFIMMTDRYCCPYDVLKRFDSLPYKNKVCFTVREYEEFQSCVRVKKGNSKTCVGIITDIMNIFGKRMYQYNFDYVKWLNQGGAGKLFQHKK